MTPPAAASEREQGALPLVGWGQRVVHLAALAIGWALFVWSWWDVVQQGWDSTGLQWLLGGSLVVLPTLTVAWTLHNVGIHRRKGPRTRVREVDDAYRRDWNGREIAADFARVRQASIVVIRIEGERKVYTAAGPVAAPGFTPPVNRASDPAAAPGYARND